MGLGDGAATETVITAVLATRPAGASAMPEDEIRVVALALFDAIAEHQWLVTRLILQIVRNPAGPVTVGILVRIGRQVGARRCCIGGSVDTPRRVSRH
ncbi:hypothetical protein [Micromonospora sp. KC207]|uniref:hypothetical protein n=1 Tax=Micromonospora sp. KC207 TaxID=2530377 RepID=UPI001A9D8614|nr:hypothetical protein [Micromonospora sp. KC207]